MRRTYLVVVCFITALLVSCSSKQVRTTGEETNRAAEFLKFGNQFLQQGDYENAFRAFSVVYENYPTSAEYIDAVIGLSKCYGAFKDYDKQFELLYSLIRENMVPSRVPEIYLLIAEFYENSAGISEQLTGAGDKDYQTAIDYLKKAVAYENSNDTLSKAHAQFKIGHLYEKLGDFENAIAAYQDTINRFGGTVWAEEAEKQIQLIREKMRLQAQYEQLKSGNQGPESQMPAADTLRSVASPEDTSATP